MIEFGKGPLLKDVCPWLKDDGMRIERILAVTEVNSVIEGLPPLQEETRRRLRERLTNLSLRGLEPGE